MHIGNALIKLGFAVYASGVSQSSNLNRKEVVKDTSLRFPRPSCRGHKATTRHKTVRPSTPKAVLKQPR